ncbi:MAG TPA: 4Fe-4S binding protein [Paludibacteraceae bacterium]|nr:4Fe-4S binding protein [Paludibacteraceae bacterium]HPT42576.1 4Fe-4S binding protein [Paludibacteraceae bacterium]
MLPFTAHAEVSQQAADSIAHKLNLAEDCSTCSYYATEHSVAGMINTIIIAVLVLLGSIWLYAEKKKFYILLLGVLISGAVAASYFAAPYFFSQQENVPENCPVNENKGSENTFTSPGSEFEPVETVKADKDTTAIVAVKSDEYKATPSDEFKSASSEEFSNGSKDEFTSVSTDEFSSDTSEFSTENAKTDPTKTEEIRKINYTMIYEPLAIFLILALISLLIKYEWFRKIRGFFLLASVIYLGFYRGACPCMISSFQNGVLMIFGVPVAWESLLWFLVLIPATYLFGKVWCGWLCHLGALQELIGRSSKLDFLTGRKVQRTLKIIQISVFVIWILQMLITRTNIFCEYDPFKVAFNLFSANWLGWILLPVLIVSSLLIHRPFCRTVCPVGLILGWVSLIPGAKKLDKTTSCINCKMCSNECAVRAMIHENKTTTLKQEDCIMCGECMSSCKKQDALHVKRIFRKKNVISVVLIMFFAVQGTYAQWECPSRMGATLKPIGGSNLMWTSEITTSGGFIGDYKIANLMLFGGLDYSINHHTFYVEGGVKNWVRNDSLNITNSQALKFGMREAFYRFSNDNHKLTIGLQSTKSDDYFLINERLAGANYKATFGRFNLNVLGGSVLKQSSRNGTFCTVGYLINVVPGRERALIGNKFGQTNVSMVSLTYVPSSGRDEFSSEFSTSDASKSIFKLNEAGGLAYYEFGNGKTISPFITGIYASSSLAGINLKPELLYQAAENNHALLYNIEVSKNINWSGGQLTKLMARYYGLHEISDGAVALNSYSNVFAGDVLRLDALELPFFQAGIKHSFPTIKSSVKLQAALQTGKTSGFIDDNFSTVPARMKEFDLSFSKNFGKYILITAYGGYIEHPTLSVDGSEFRYLKDASPWGKVEVRFTF